MTRVGLEKRLCQNQIRQRYDAFMYLLSRKALHQLANVSNK